MMPVTGQLLDMLRTVAQALGPDLRQRLVFVGGSTTALFITDVVTREAVRLTDDVDLIVKLAGYPEWTVFQTELRNKGFVESPDDTVICRMRLGALKVDFMPDDSSILGFSNRWYARGIETAVSYALSQGLDIKILEPAYFVATKLEAYLGRGKDDLFTSRDVEDVLLIVDGRPQLIEEIQISDPDLRVFVAEEISALLANPDFEYFLAGNIRGPDARVDLVHKRLLALTKIGSA